MQSKKPVNYPDPVIFDNERLIFARFDGANGTARNVPIFFSNSDVLTNKIITGIDVTLRGGRLTSVSNDIQTDIGYIGDNILQADLKYFTITLIGKNGDVLLNDYPLYNFNVLANNGKIRRLSLMIDLSKSYIRNFGVTVTKTTVIPINFYYKNK